ncbi:vancomycin resistance histidine kinase VanS [Paenibacillus sp. FSL H7-0326]|uniref:vancomycin resistance histidine kinase VanS n=1 Tax=unclassified Paenibacillus TaxID=185978 RepID=UPI0008969E76|nr:vancomycin resistance histidine kinase VanS [Paenibacillus sp. FSL H7-0326]SDX51566.1 two-component system, OmpR family, sensor histidine kinase VanS [Paenibacillus sp. PDC88]
MKDDFRKLKNKIITQILLTAVLTAIIGFAAKNILIDGVLEAPFADAFIRFAEVVLNIEYKTAVQLYYLIFQQNKDLILGIFFILLLFLIFYWTLSRATHYFNEINRSMDKLVEESDEPITLSPELEVVERKMNLVKDTLKKRMKDAQEAEQRKNDLVVYLAHDIKTPLTSIIGYLSLLDEAQDMPMEQKAKYVNITLEKAYRLEQLINEFFDITRFNLQKIILEQMDISLSMMLMQIADEFHPMLAEHELTVSVQVDEQLTLHGDPDKLARVFNNIMKNAIHYSYSGTNVAVTAVKQQGAVVITFANVGETIPPHKLNTIFEKFYRLDTARSSATGGAGLGLAIAKEIVNAHGGTITASSENSHTMFIVKLPGRS